MAMFHVSEQYSLQYGSYKLIHDRANQTIRKKLSMVDKLTDYNGLTKIKHDKEINNKKKSFHNLEMQIISIKQNSVDQEVLLKQLQRQISNTQAAVKEQQRRNFHMNNANLSQK